MSGSVDAKCPRCRETLIPGKMYCPNCGQALAAPDRKDAIDAYIVAKVAQELALRTQNEGVMVREIGYKAENEVRARLKQYSWVVGAFIALLALFGVTSIRDARQTIVAEAKNRVEPVISDVEKRAQAARTSLADVEERLPGVTDSLNKTANLADQQRLRIEAQSADVMAKLQSFNVAAKRADEIGSGFETKVKQSQTRLDDLTRRYDKQLDQISRAVTHRAVAEAFPTLDREPFIQIGPVRLDQADKKPNDKWVNIHVTHAAMERSVISAAQLEQLVSELRAAGFTPLLGQMQVIGRILGVLERAGQGPHTESGVLYFRPNFKGSADALTAITKKYVRLPEASPQLTDSAKLDAFTRPRVEVLLKNGKLDAQIFISALLM